MTVRTMPTFNASLNGSRRSGFVLAFLTLAMAATAQAGRFPKNAPAPSAGAGAGAGASSQAVQDPHESKNAPLSGAGAGAQAQAGAERSPIPGMANVAFQMLREDEELLEALASYRQVVAAQAAGLAPAAVAQLPAVMAALRELSTTAGIAAASAVAATTELWCEMENDPQDLEGLNDYVMERLLQELQSLL